MRPWEPFVSSCCVLAKQKCSSCEVRFSQAAPVLLPAFDGITCKATYRWSRKTKCTHGTCTASLWPPTPGSLLTRDIWGRGSAARHLSPLVIIRCNPSFPAGEPCPHEGRSKAAQIKELIRGEESIGTEASTVNFEI